MLNKVMQGRHALRMTDITVVAGAMITITGHNVFAGLNASASASQSQGGDTLVLRDSNSKDISIGSIAMLPLDDGSGKFYTHRIITKEINSEGLPVITTKGDANPLPDKWRLTIKSPKVPIYLADIPTAALPFLEFNAFTSALLLGALFIAFISVLKVSKRNLVRK